MPSRRPKPEKAARARPGRGLATRDFSYRREPNPTAGPSYSLPAAIAGLAQGGTHVLRTKVGGLEQTIRMAAGAAVACGFFGLGYNPIGYVVAGMGLLTALTGLFGFCPACAMAGRRKCLGFASCFADQNV